MLNSSVNLGDWASKGGKGMGGWVNHLSEVSLDGEDLLTQGGSAVSHPRHVGEGTQ